MDSDLKGSLVTCPLCGMHKPLSDKVFQHSKLDRFLTLGNSQDGPNAANVAHDKKINIDDLAKKEDLSWMRRQVIRRCTEIINNLAA
jgi:hypothetical protein